MSLSSPIPSSLERIESMSRFRPVALFTICLSAAFAQGWIVLTFHSAGVWLLYLGVVGAIPFLLLNGVHGDAEGLMGIVGGILYVLTNGAIYYLIVNLILKLRRRRQRRSRSSRMG
jgi:hypothetical protein